MKAPASGEVKLTLNTADDYRKLRKTLNHISSFSDNDKKELGPIKYHTYRLQEDKTFSVFIRGIHFSTDPADVYSELISAGHQVVNGINILIKKKVDNKSILVKLPLFKVELKTANNNSTIFDIRSLCQ